MKQNNKDWQEEFDEKFVKGYGDSKVDWTYPEEGNVIKFIQSTLDQQRKEIEERVGEMNDHEADAFSDSWKDGYIIAKRQVLKIIREE